LSGTLVTILSNFALRSEILHCQVGKMKSVQQEERYECMSLFFIYNRVFKTKRGLICYMQKQNKIAVIGGAGKAGRYVVEKALEAGYQVRVLTRNPKQFKAFYKHVEIIKGDVRDVEVIRTLFNGCHTVISTLGKPKKESFIFSSATNNILTVMNELHILRYIVVSGGSVDVPGDKKSFLNKMGARMFRILFPNMMKDKYKELNLLLESNLDWTFVRLPFVVEGVATGSIKESLRDIPGLKIYNSDIADFLIKQIASPLYIRKCPFIAN